MCVCGGLRPGPAYPQGTAATALAGVYGALRVLGCRSAEIAKQRIVCVGAGSAGMGVVKMVAAGVRQALLHYLHNIEQAAPAEQGTVGAVVLALHGSASLT